MQCLEKFCYEWTRWCVCDMAPSYALLPLLLLATLTVATVIELSQETSDSPVITSTNLGEIVVNPGENYSITCEGHTPVIWNYPDIADNEPRIQQTQQNGKYESSIQLINITYKNVGYYHCLLNNRKKNSSIYLYVNDTENLLTYDELAFAPIHTLEHDDIIIPCKPTHPEVNVTLCRNGDEKLHIGDNDYFGVVRYDQKVGFILENAQLTHNGYYFCCVLPGGICSQECIPTYSVEVLRCHDRVARPAIDVGHLQHVKVGENVTIECRVAVPPYIKCDLEWIIPNESNRIIVEHIVVEPPVSHEHHLSSARRNLRILNAKLEDAGNYTCKVVDHYRNTNNATIYLNIFSE